MWTKYENENQDSEDQHICPAGFEVLIAQGSGETDDQATLAKLDSLAGEKAKVSGTLDGDTIKVSSVADGQ